MAREAARELPNRDSLLEVVGERMRHLAQLCEEAGARSAEFTPRYPRLSLGSPR